MHEKLELSAEPRNTLLKLNTGILGIRPNEVGAIIKYTEEELREIFPGVDDMTILEVMARADFSTNLPEGHTYSDPQIGFFGG